MATLSSEIKHRRTPDLKFLESFKIVDKNHRSSYHAGNQYCAKAAFAKAFGVEYPDQEALGYWTEEDTKKCDQFDRFIDSLPSEIMGVLHWLEAKIFNNNRRGVRKGVIDAAKAFAKYLRQNKAAK